MEVKNSEILKKLKKELAIKKTSRKIVDSEIDELEAKIKYFELLSDNQTKLF